MKYYRKEATAISLPEGESVPKGFVEITESEFAEINDAIAQINELIFELKKTDYKAIKHSEGLISDEDYESIKADRQSIRERIREIEATLK